MELSKNKKILIILVIVLTALLLFSLIVLLLKRPESGESLSYPISNTVETEPIKISSEIEFTLRQVNLLSPSDGKVSEYHFISSINKDDVVYTFLKPSEYDFQINSEDFNILIYTKSEAFGGIFKASSTQLDVNNNLNISMSRVGFLGDNFIKDIFNNIGIKNRFFYYFYSQNTNASCVKENETDYCGADHFEIQSNQDRRYDANIILYCTVKEEEAVQYCDEFVKNLEVKSETIETFPVSYFRQ